MQEAQAQNQAAMEQAGGFGGRRLASASTGNLDELYQQHAARMDAGGLGNGFGAGGGAGGGGMAGLPRPRSSGMRRCRSVPLPKYLAWLK